MSDGLITTPFGAQTTAVEVIAGVDRGGQRAVVTGVTGRYFEDCNEAKPLQPGIRRGVAAYALDPEKARLWQLSVEMLAGHPEPV